MKKSILIALSIALALTFTTCKDDDGGGGGGSNGLTITGLPSSEIWQVFVYPAGTDVSNSEAYFFALSKIEAGNYGGTINGFSPLFRADAPGSPWTGSGSRSVRALQRYRHIGPR